MSGAEGKLLGCDSQHSRLCLAVERAPRMLALRDMVFGILLSCQKSKRGSDLNLEL